MRELRIEQKKTLNLQFASWSVFARNLLRNHLFLAVCATSGTFVLFCSAVYIKESDVSNIGINCSRLISIFSIRIVKSMPVQNFWRMTQLVFLWISPRSPDWLSVGFVVRDNSGGSILQKSVFAQAFFVNTCFTKFISHKKSTDKKIVKIFPVEMTFHVKFHVSFWIWSNFLGMVVHHISTCTADHPDHLVPSAERITLCCSVYCELCKVSRENNSHAWHNSHTRSQPQPQNDPSVTSSCTYTTSSSSSSTSPLS